MQLLKRKKVIHFMLPDLTDWETGPDHSFLTLAGAFVPPSIVQYVLSKLRPPTCLA